MNPAARPHVGPGAPRPIPAELLRSRDAALYLRPYLKSADAQIRGFAAPALGYLQDGASLSAIEKLQGDPGPLRFYEDGEIRVTCVGELARRALAEVDAPGCKPAGEAGLGKL